jgi:hypothetical protein
MVHFRIHIAAFFAGELSDFSPFSVNVGVGAAIHLLSCRFTQRMSLSPFPQVGSVARQASVPAFPWVVTAFQAGVLFVLH